jgi:hypothetical protein
MTTTDTNKPVADDQPPAGTATVQPTAGGPPGEAQPPKPIEGPRLQALADGVSAIMKRSVHDFLQWSNGFLNWSNSQLLNGIPVPPQAHADYQGRLSWLIAFLEQFSESVAILQGAGSPEPAAQLNEYLNGLRGLLATHKETRSAMQADDFATAQKIQGIQNEMSKTNAAAAAERLALQKDAAATNFATHADLLRKQQESSDRHHGNIMGLLKS